METEKIKEAAQYVKEKIGEVPSTAVVLGSGMSEVFSGGKTLISLPYNEIPNFPLSTVKGHKGALSVIETENKKVLVLEGRFHYYEGYKMDEVTMYVRVLKLLGVENLILTCATGGANESFNKLDIVLITDHISFFCPSPLRGPNKDEFGTRFPPMVNAYNKELLAVAEAAAKEVNIGVKKGTYFYAPGPQFETPVEVKAARMLGADVCGMSTVPETIVAVHSGMRVLGIAYISNMAAGIGKNIPNHEEVLLSGKVITEKFGKLLPAIIKKL